MAVYNLSKGDNQSEPAIVTKVFNFKFSDGLIDPLAFGYIDVALLPQGADILFAGVVVRALPNVARNIVVFIQSFGGTAVGVLGNFNAMASGLTYVAAPTNLLAPNLGVSELRVFLPAVLTPQTVGEFDISVTYIDPNRSLGRYTNEVQL